MNRDLQATIAMGWIEEDVPDDVVMPLHQIIDQWRQDTSVSESSLWLRLIDCLRQLGCFDSEVAACRHAVILFPQQSGFRLRLAQALHRIGGDEEALRVIVGIPALDPYRADALVFRLTQFSTVDAVDGPLCDELEQLLLNSADWGLHHGSLVEMLIRRGLQPRAEAFFLRWKENGTPSPDGLIDLGGAAMQLGHPEWARPLFTPVLLAAAELENSVLGRFLGHIPPYDQTIEATLLQRVEAAFALPDEALARQSLGQGGKPPPGLTVLYLSFEDRDLPNDLAWHIQRSADKAGVALSLYQDSALVLPSRFRGDDQAVTARMNAFSAELGRQKPDVLILDCCHPVIHRGITPTILNDLRQQHGFKLVVMMRDAHSYAMSEARLWLEVCDSLAVFDPCSPICQEDTSGKVIPVPVFTMYLPYAPVAVPDRPVTFIGSVVFLWRLALLSLLQTESVEFQAIIGESRLKEAPHMEAYLDLLRRAKAVLNIAVHTPSDCLITGRVWETIAVGGLLMEQANPSIERFFTPYRHYLPWSNPEDIVHLIQFIEKFPEIRRRIADEAHGWAERHYGVKAFWDALLGHALLDR